MQALAYSVRSLVAETKQIHMDYQILWRKRDSMAIVSREECPDPCLNRLLLLFWALCIEDGPHLLCTGRLALGGYLLQKTKERMLLITSKREDIYKCKRKSG